VDDLPAKAGRPLRMESAEDRHCPAAATGIEHGTTRTFSMWAGYVRCAGTLDRGPGGVLRSIGQSAAPCQKQNGTFSSPRGRSHPGVAAQYDATTDREELYSLC
jgi:hypothetical protein